MAVASYDATRPAAAESPADSSVPKQQRVGARRATSRPRSRSRSRLLSLDITEGHGCVVHTRSQPSAPERTLSALFGNLDGLRGASSAFRAVTSSIVVAHRCNLGMR